MKTMVTWQKRRLSFALEDDEVSFEHRTRMISTLQLDKAAQDLWSMNYTRLRNLFP